MDQRGDEKLRAVRLPTENEVGHANYLRSDVD